jgi:hypothetical protein
MNINLSNPRNYGADETLDDEEEDAASSEDDEMDAEEQVDSKIGWPDRVVR